MRSTTPTGYLFRPSRGRLTLLSPLTLTWKFVVCFGSFSIDVAISVHRTRHPTGRDAKAFRTIPGEIVHEWRPEAQHL